MRSLAAIAVVLTVWVVLPCSANAQLSAEQQQELARIGNDLQRASLLLAQFEPQQAQRILADVEKRLAKLAKDTGTPPNDPTLLTLQMEIATRKQATAQMLQAAGLPVEPPMQQAQQTVSFVKHIAPILVKRCTGCHGEDTKNGLRLDSFNAVANGGTNGPVIATGNADGSPLALRLIARGKQRMPKNAKALPKAEIQAIAVWINEGANFDGVDPAALLSAAADGAKNEGDPAFPAPTGKETVSFSRDVAPFMANICLRCHSGAEPRGGLSIETFAKLMKGGESGAVIVPGKPEESRLFRLTGGLELPRMPQGEARLTKKNYEDLKAWIAEGAKFDGKGATTPLRELVPSAVDSASAKFAAMSPEEIQKHRSARSQQQWKRVLPKETAETYEADQFLLLGNVSAARLKQIAVWADDHLAAINALLPSDRTPTFPGRLAVFVMKDRYSYTEFNLVIDKRQPPAELTSHGHASPSFEDAYVVVQDTGDGSKEAPGLRLQLGTEIARLRLASLGTNLPDWLEQGTALQLASQSEPSNPFLKASHNKVTSLLSTVKEPTAIFADGTFAPGDVGVVGASLVTFLLSNGGPEKLSALLTAMQQGADCGTALKNVYSSDPAEIAGAFAGWQKSQR